MAIAEVLYILALKILDMQLVVSLFLFDLTNFNNFL